MIGEIFARIGDYKVGQKHKIANDILKMLLLDKVKCKKHRKMIIVCSDNEKSNLERGASWLSETIRQFEIEIVKIDISEEIKKRIIDAQERQKMINA